jgi:transcriptional regulator with PAS, ATPase and Fis domain
MNAKETSPVNGAAGCGPAGALDGLGFDDDTPARREGISLHPDGTSDAFRNFIGDSRPMRRLRDLIEHVAGANTTVLIRGESGVGKELVARAVHRLSERLDRPFVVVDCAALHDNLLQSELFGHERGAYTDAVRLKQGLFEVANGGTLLLDEIAELTPALQVKLLRVLETGTFRRLGGTIDLHVDVRVVAATNRPLERMLEEGGFREDLYYRLNVFPLDVPSLRERPEDIPPLVHHFIRHSTLVKGERIVHPDTMELLERHRWPGNVRELENVIERALILCEGGTIEPRHLPAALQHPRSHPVAAGGEASVALHDIERRHILRVLEACGGHRERAAHLLQISERTLYRRLKEVAHERAGHGDAEGEARLRHAVPAR